MRIIYFGTPYLAVAVLEAVNSSKHEIVLVVTQPDRPKGRSKELIPPPVKICAEKLGLNLIQPEKIDSPELFSVITLQAKGKSKHAPSFLSPAGAIFSITLPFGKTKLEFKIADLNRTFDSLTALPGSPTISIPGRDLEKIFISICTKSPS